MPGENKRFSGSQEPRERPDVDIERRPEGGPIPKKRQKAYGFTEPLSDTPASARHSDGENPQEAVKEALKPRR